MEHPKSSQVYSSQTKNSEREFQVEVNHLDNERSYSQETEELTKPAQAVSNLGNDPKIQIKKREQKCMEKLTNR